jgi:hypothetical protein
VREEKARISKMALVKVSVGLDVEWAKAEATCQDYLDKTQVHMARAKHTLGLDKMLGLKMVQLDGKERDLDLHEVALEEVHSWGLNPRGNHEEIMELVELRRHL